MGCGCHVDNRVDSLAVQKQKSLIVEQWVFGWKRTLGRGKNVNTRRSMWAFIGGRGIKIIVEISRC